MDVGALLDLLTKAGVSVGAALGAYVAIKQDIAAIRERIEALKATQARTDADLAYQRDRLEKHLDRARRNTET